MASRSLSALVLLSLLALTRAQKDNGTDCQCFTTNSSSGGYFTYHRFHDYRNVGFQSVNAPVVLTSAGGTSQAPPTSSFFTASSWTADWTIQAWNNSDTSSTEDASILMVNSANNVYIDQSNDDSPDYSTYLTLRTTRQPGFQSAAEFDSTEQNFHYLSARFMARVVGSPGACAGMFTYDPSPNAEKVQESDIEILTQGPRNAIQFTNQPSVDSSGNVVPQATVNATNPLDWSSWNAYRVDWMPEGVSWYVNGESLANISYQTPKSPSQLIINMWSDGGPWTGNMSIYDEAYLQIQWIELAYNTSGSYTQGNKRNLHSIGDIERRKSKGCTKICSVDETNTTGTPVEVQDSAGILWKPLPGSMLFTVSLMALLLGFL